MIVVTTPLRPLTFSQQLRLLRRSGFLLLSLLAQCVTRLRLVDVTDRVTVNYRVLSRPDTATLDTRLSTYTPSLSPAPRISPPVTIRPMRRSWQSANYRCQKPENLSLYTALQSNLTQKVRLDQYLPHHPSRTTQSYPRARRCLLQPEHSLADLPLSSPLPVALPSVQLPVAAAATAPAPPPTAPELAALKAQLTRPQGTETRLRHGPYESPPSSPPLVASALRLLPLHLLT